MNGNGMYLHVQFCWSMAMLADLSVYVLDRIIFQLSTFHKETWNKSYKQR